MKASSANCPEWLTRRILNAGGSISFHQYMDWALNDPEHGAYSSGRLKVGKQGDFVTSPACSSDFAALLAEQIADWFAQLESINVQKLPLTLVEIGPGEGDLIYDLLSTFKEKFPEIIDNLEIILVEPNEGMLARQKIKLSSISHDRIRWCSLKELSIKPVFGIIIAHEILDALPVERVVLKDSNLFRQGVKINSKGNDIERELEFDFLPLTKHLERYIKDIETHLSIEIPPMSAPDSWCTELHTELANWFDISSKAIVRGAMLIIDYALEAKRYYSSARPSGSLMSYKGQRVTDNPFIKPGYWDITSHLCIEVLEFLSSRNSWTFLGEVRQGQALLALGLARRLHSLQSLPPDQLNVALIRREALLRLVDPAGLGEFRWFAFAIDNLSNSYNEDWKLKTKFLSSNPY